MFDYERLEALSIEGEAPQSEPERQYYFMKKARAILKQKAEELGRPLTACTVNSDARLSDECKGLGEDDSNS